MPLRNDVNPIVFECGVRLGGDKPAENVLPIPLRAVHNFQTAVIGHFQTIGYHINLRIAFLIGIKAEFAILAAQNLHRVEQLIPAGILILRLADQLQFVALFTEIQIVTAVFAV